MPNVPPEVQQHVDVASYARSLLGRATIQIAEMNNAQTLLSWLDAIIERKLIVIEPEPPKPEPDADEL